MRRHWATDVHSACLGLLSVLFPVAAFAGDGIWAVDNGGNWSTPGNWVGNVVADGSDSRADFAGVNITADRTVTVDSARTIGHLVFGDTSGGQNWTLGGAGPLTLSVSSNTPTLALTNAGLTLGTTVAGTQGFTKLGPAAVTYATANAYGGTTTLSGGWAYIANGQCFGTSRLVLQNGIGMRSTSTTAHTIPNATVLAGGVYFGYAGSTAPGNLTFSGPVTLAADNARAIVVSDGGYAMSFAGGIGEDSPGRALIVTGGSSAGSLGRSGALSVSGTLSYTGPTRVLASTLRLGSHLTASSYVEVNHINYASWGYIQYGTLELASPTDDRIGGGVPVRLRGGKLYVSSSAGSWSETIEDLRLDPGTSYIHCRGNGGTTTLTLAGVRRNGGTAVFRADGSTGRIFISGLPTGFVGGWALYGDAGQGSAWDWATNSAAGGIARLTAYETADEGPGWTSDKDIKMMTNQTLTSSRTINSLLMEHTTNATLTIGAAYVLNVASGGLMIRDARPNVSSIPFGDWRGSTIPLVITGTGSLTAGTVGKQNLCVNVVGEHTYNWQGTSSIWTMQTAATIEVPITDGPGGAVTLIKSGSGWLTLSGSSVFTGGMFVNTGVTRLTAANAIKGVVTVAPGAKLVLDHPAALPGSAYLSLEHYGESYAAVDLQQSVTVSCLQFNGAYQPKGDYSSATHPSYFTGSGTLRVLRDGPPRGTVVTFR